MRRRGKRGTYREGEVRGKAGKERRRGKRGTSMSKSWF